MSSNIRRISHVKVSQKLFSAWCFSSKILFAFQKIPQCNELKEILKINRRRNKSESKISEKETRG